METNKNCKLVIQDLISHFLLQKSLQHQKRYLHRGLYNPCETKIREFIFRITNIIKYLDQLPSFSYYQGLPQDKILEIVDFAMS